MPTDIPIRSQSIDLDQFLKFAGLVSTGGEAKYVILEGLVTVNGVIETRRRRTLHPGDLVAIEDGDAARVTREEE